MLSGITFSNMGRFLRYVKRGKRHIGDHRCGSLLATHQGMTDTTPNLTIPGSALAELRVRVDVLNKVLAELVGRAAPADSESAGLLRIAWEHARAIAETIAGTEGS